LGNGVGGGGGGGGGWLGIKMFCFRYSERNEWGHSSTRFSELAASVAVGHVVLYSRKFNCHCDVIVCI